MNNISLVHHCYGCGVCAITCPQSIIRIELNEDGFYEPAIINESGCLNCGLCLKVCAFSHDDLVRSSQCVGSYAAWSDDPKVRSRSTSGGVSYELGRSLLQQGYLLCGVKYDAPLNRAEHYIASSLEEWKVSVGSKYIQSYTVDGFAAIDRKRKYLVTGTPCQMDSFRRYIQHFHCEENFVLMDFFCHGVPSMLMFDKYVRQNDIRRQEGDTIIWRNKKYGWHDSYAMTFTTQSGKKVISRQSQYDDFYMLFLSDVCLGKACYDHCKYKNLNSSADIRIGDFWGRTFADNEEGVNGVLAFSHRGDEILQQCHLQLIPYDLNVVTEHQMKENAVYPVNYDQVWPLVKSPGLSLQKASVFRKREIRRRRLINRVNHILRILKIPYLFK